MLLRYDEMTTFAYSAAAACHNKAKIFECALDMSIAFPKLKQICT